MTVIDFGKQPEKEDTRELKLLKLGGVVLAIILGSSILWAAAAYWGNSIYYAIPIMVGAGLVRIMSSPFSPLNFIKGVGIFVVSFCLTLGSIALGEILFSVLYVLFEWDYSLGEAIYISLVNIVEVVASVDGVVGYFAGFIGAVLGSYSVFRENKQNKGGHQR